MKNGIITTIILAICLMSFSVVQAQTQEFTYQGSLADASVPQPTNGTYDFEFALFDASTGGSQIGSTLTRSNVSVVNGIFTVNLNFAGASFSSGSPQFLEIRVFDTGTSSFVTLNPRQTVTAAPYAYRARNAQDATNATNLTSQLGGDVTGNYQSTTVQRVGGKTRNEIQSAVTMVQGATPNSFSNRLVLRGLTGEIAVNSYRFGSTEALTRSSVSGVGLTVKVGGTGDAVGIPQVATLGSDNVCLRPGSGVLVFANCSSSLRYKENIFPYTFGLSVINQLQPISYVWKNGGIKDTGFGAEDVEKIDKRFVTYNDKGQVEGVKYNRLSVVFVNAFKEQQAQIEKLQSENKTLKTQFAELKKLVCATNEKAEICKEAK